MCSCKYCGRDIAYNATTCPKCGGQNPCDKCFITTACVDTLGLKDDCYEMTTLRWFRDNYMRSFQEGKSDVNLYYKVAPKIIQAIKNTNTADEEFKSVYNTWIVPSVKYIEKKQYKEAYQHYKDCILHLSNKYNIDLN